MFKNVPIIVDQSTIVTPTHHHHPAINNTATPPHQRQPPPQRSKTPASQHQPHQTTTTDDTRTTMTSTTTNDDRARGAMHPKPIGISSFHRILNLLTLFLLFSSREIAVEPPPTHHHHHHGPYPCRYEPLLAGRLGRDDGGRRTNDECHTPDNE